MTVIKDSLCANFECQHGAKCKVVNKRPKCECYPAWGGRHCEQLLVQPIATSTEQEDTTSSSLLPKIWTETITENSVEVRTKNFPRHELCIRFLCHTVAFHQLRFFIRVFQTFCRRLFCLQL